MNNNLEQNLAAIFQGTTIDADELKSQLLRRGVTEAEYSQAIEVTRYSDKDHLVKIVDESAFQGIIDYLSIDVSTRVGASLAGNSHMRSVKGAILNIWAAEETTLRGLVFMPGKSVAASTKPNALIIENLECFLYKEETYEFVRSMCGVDFPIESVEFVYGSGNSISNKLITHYLQSFTGDVMCLLDVDLGGLRIFSNLMKGGVRAEKLKYLVPKDLKKRLERSRRKATEKERLSLPRLLGVSEVTDQVISAIQYYGTTLEQESYRAEK